MDESYESYRYAFESCRSYKEGSVSINDFTAICRRFSLSASKFIEVIADREKRVSLDKFFHYLMSYPQQPNYYNHDEEYRSTTPHIAHPPPTRPHSASKPHRQGTYSSHHYQSRHVLKYPPSGHYDQDEYVLPEDLKRQSTRQELNRTPEHYLSPEERSIRHDRLRPPDQLDHYPTSDYTSHTRHPRPSSPLPSLSSHHSRRTHNREAPSRLDRARSYKAEDSDDGSVNGDSYYPPPAPSRRPTCKGCKALQRQLQEQQEDLKAMRGERERLEQSNERLRKDLQMSHQSADLAYAQVEKEQLYRDNERLRQELKRWRKDADPDSDRAYFDRQYEELKKAKDSLEEEIHRLKAYKKECGHLKAEYNAIKLKNEQLQRTNWQLVDENHRLNVRLMEDDKSSFLSRRPGDGGSEEASARSSYASELGFQRNTQLRQTYHFAGVTRDPPSSSSRPRKVQGMEMKRTSSAGHVLDYDEPVKEDAKMESYAHSFSRAKSHEHVRPAHNRSPAAHH